MNPAPRACPLCLVAARTDVWNGLDILTCPSCALSWRASFDLPDDFYKTVPVDCEEGKRKKREANCRDQIHILKKILPAEGIFDLGAGDGTFLWTLEQKGYKNCIGFEPGRNGLAYARERGVRMVEGDIVDFHAWASDKKIPAVTMFHLIEHLANPQEAVGMIYDVLMPGGILVVETPDANAPLQRFTQHRNHLVYPEHLFYWNERSLRQLLTRAGFSVIMVRRRSFDWRQTSISNSLLRLGLAKGGNITEKRNIHQLSSDAGQRPADQSTYLRSLVRVILAQLVHLLGRDDYVMIVAVKKTNDE